MTILYYIIPVVLGLLIGSFLNVCIHRLPKGESVVAPPSHCTGCGSRLKALDLIPIFSFLLLKGRCRYCGAGISPRYPLIELLTAAVFAVLFNRFLLSVEFFAAAYLMAILIAVFFIDIEHKIIPDQLVIAGLVGSAALTVYNFFRPVEIFGEMHWWSRLLGLLPGTCILLLISFIGLIIYKTDEAMGGGDVKLFAPIGMFLGWKLCLVSLMLAVAFGGVIGAVLILTGIKKRKDTIAFGPFIVAGTFIAVLWGTEIVDWYIRANGF